ncbi:M23 family metallopeptidase [Bacteroidota bacterium]
MKNYYFIFITAVLFTFVFFISCSEESTVKETEDPLIAMSVACAPIPVMSNKGMNLAYCVDLSDYTKSGLTMIKASVINGDNGTIIESYSDSILAMHMVMPSDPLPTESEKMNGTKKQDHPVFFVWLKLDEGEVPSKISHEFTFQNAGSKEIIETGAVTVVNNIQPVIISPPMRGSGWFTLETTECFTHHFKNEVTHGGKVYCPERFAVDFLQADSLDNFFTGDETLNENWVCYGKELLAVANGVVTAIHGGVPNNTPVGEIFELDFQDMAGNYVIIDIGNNHYVAYCHMIPGSIKVKVGDEVKTGDVLGLLGNSGNSGAPHLHFQITTGNSFYAGEGLPYVFDEYLWTADGEIDWVSGDIKVTYHLPSPERMTNRLPENLRVLDFK